MRENNIGPSIIAAAIIIALGMYSLGSAIRVAGDRVGTGASNSGTDIAFPQDFSGRFRVERASPEFAGPGREAFWVIDLSANDIALYEFWVDQHGIVEKNTRFQGRLR